MKLGVIFPQTELGANPDDVARFAQAVEEIGYSHLVCYEHVLGASSSGSRRRSVRSSPTFISERRW